MRRNWILIVSVATALALAGCVDTANPTYEGTVDAQPNLTGAMYRVGLEVVAAKVSPDYKTDAALAIQAGAKGTYEHSIAGVVGWLGNETVVATEASYLGYLRISLNGSVQPSNDLPPQVTKTNQSPDRIRSIRIGSALDQASIDLEGNQYSKIEIIDEVSGKVQELQTTASRYPSYFHQKYVYGILPNTSSSFGPGLRVFPGDRASFAWSPDGEKIAFRCLSGRRTTDEMICLFRLERLQ